MKSSRTNKDLIADVKKAKTQKNIENIFPLTKVDIEYTNAPIKPFNIGIRKIKPHKLNRTLIGTLRDIPRTAHKP